MLLFTPVTYMQVGRAAGKISCLYFKEVQDGKTLKLYVAYT